MTTTQRFVRISALALVISLGASAAMSGRAWAQEQAQVAPDVANAKYTMVGVVNATAVNVRSGPGDNYYPVMQLDKGAQVTVMGKRFTWLKIVPPEGSFCYVAKAYVTRQGDGNKGQVDHRVDGSPLNVRAGSSLNAMKTTVVAQLPEGAAVSILDEQDEYYKIKPPAGAYYYIDSRYVDPVKPAGVAGASTEPSAEPGVVLIADAPADVADHNHGTAIAAPEPAAPATTEPAVADAAAAPGTVTTPEVKTPAPALPVVNPAAEKFDALEAEFAEVAKKPVLDVPVEELLASYQTLVKDERLFESMRRVADVRIKVLQARADARAEFAATKKAQEERAKTQLSLKAEREELEQRIKENDVQVYAAVGQLQTSSLQVGQVPLFRLIDPGTGRTLIYVRSDDTKVRGLVGQFVGVRGDVVNDQQLNLKLILPTEAQVVDPAQVHKKVAAPITPPSLLQKSVQASVEGNNK